MEIFKCRFSVLLTVLGIVRNVFAASNISTCADTCTSLSQLLGDKVVPSTSDNFNTALGLWFSAQESELVPSCVVLPSSADDVSIFIKKLAEVNQEYTTCPFAVKSGGHTPTAGAANIYGGITLYLGKLKDVSLNTDKSVVSIGGGARWKDVYSLLTPLDLSVAGARNGDVGAGGFLTGGGISFFSGRTGFSCDTITNIEIILASGLILNTNSHSNSTLFRALKGGSNNFGIVTRFDVRVFPQTDYLGGSIINLIDSADSQISAFTKSLTDEVYDPFVSIILTFFWSPQYGFLISNNLAHTSPNSSLTDPPESIKPFLDIQSQLASTLRTSNVSDFVNELTSTGAGLVGLRNSYATSTFKVSADFMTNIFTLWNESMSSLISTPGLVSAGLTFEPIPTTMLSPSSPNSFGLNPSSGSLVLFQLSFTWLSSSSDAAIELASQELIANIDSKAREKELNVSWKYLNYAAEWQDVIGGYGGESQANLRVTSGSFDPEGVFQKVVKGGYKISPSS